MKQLVIPTIIVLSIIVGLYGQEKAQAGSQMKMELIYQKPFDEIAGSEGFPPSEIKTILNRKDILQEDKDWLLNSLRIEIAKRKNILYTNDGKVVQLPDDLKSIATSDNLNYMIVYAAHYDYGGMSREDAGIVRRKASEARRKSIKWGMKWEEAGRIEKYIYIDSVYYWIKMRDSLGLIDISIQKNTKHIKTVICLETETGKVLWQKEGWINTFYGKGEDIFLPSYISNDGKTSIAVPRLGPANQFYRSIYFYDENGNERKTVTGLYGESGCHDLSSDGEMFCTLIQIKRNDTKMGAVAAYDKDGNELWITEIPGHSPPAPPCIAISPNHKYIAASIWGTNLLNEKGDIINTYECRTYKPEFSADEKYLMLGYPRDTIYFVQTDDGDILWKKSLGGQPYSKPFVAKDGRAIFFTDGYLLDKRGDIIWQDTNAVKSTIGLSPSGYLFIPTTNPDAIIYYLPSEVKNEN